MLSSILSWISSLWTRLTTRKQRQAEYEERVRRELEPYLRGTVWETKTTTTYAPKPKPRQWKSQEQINKEKEADMILTDSHGNSLYYTTEVLFKFPISTITREYDGYDDNDESTKITYEDGTKIVLLLDTSGHETLCEKADEWEKTGKWKENSRASKE